jgi:hypothetical protein
MSVVMYSLPHAQQVVSWGGGVGGVLGHAQHTNTRRDPTAHKGVVTRSVARRRSVTATDRTAGLASYPVAMWTSNTSTGLLLVAGLLAVIPPQASRQFSLLCSVNMFWDSSGASRGVGRVNGA